MARPPLEVADIIRALGDSISGFAGLAISAAQKRVMHALTACRTAGLGGHVEHCDHCEHERIAYNSCRNRHCAKCQAARRARWFEDRRGESDELLNTVEVLVTGPRFFSVSIDSALIDKAAHVARAARLRAYDAVYVALALNRGDALLTLDSEVRSKIAEVFPGLGTVVPSE